MYSPMQITSQHIVGFPTGGWYLIIIIYLGIEISIYKVHDNIYTLYIYGRDLVLKLLTSGMLATRLVIYQ